MKVLLINGSPNRNGCTNRALAEVADTLKKEGIDTEIFQIGNRPVYGCSGCGACEKTGRCVHDDDAANRILERMKEADGVVIGSPVYYSGANGALCALLDRVFFAGGNELVGKPAAAVVSARRSGTTATFQRLNQYFAIKKMPIVTSQYWNNVHGYTPEDVEQDLEGLQTMRTLGRNMAWMLKLTENGAAAGICFPEAEEPVATDFIR
ncbi:MAG: flavodoxin family protein [Oscillospiraceae bacterium]|nr:flavodoxin family protein [Oscillospiraceae bacterium]